MESLSQAQVAGFRLRRHHLVCRAPLKSLADVVSDVVGVQAQFMSAAQLALWARVEGITLEDVAMALWRERSLVKTWCMRGASHLLATADFPVCIGGLLRRGLCRETEWLAGYGVSQAEAEAMSRAVVEALDDEVLTRKELAQRVVAVLGSKARRWVEHSWGGIVKLACLQGLVCFGPNKGKEITFVRVDKWLPRLKDMPVEKAEETLLRRYLHGYGPAGLRDFATWSGITVREAVPILERLDSQVFEVQVEGKPRLALREDMVELQNSALDNDEKQCVRLLPSFDCFMLGHKDKSHLVDKAHYKRVYRKAGWLSPVVLVNGRTIGAWSRIRSGKRLNITVELFTKIPRSIRKRINKEVMDLARLFDTTCRVTFV